MTKNRFKVSFLSNKVVAAKCWAALFAARDWAGALDEGKKEPKPKEEVHWKQLFRHKIKIKSPISIRITWDINSPFFKPIDPNNFIFYHFHTAFG